MRYVRGKACQRDQTRLRNARYKSLAEVMLEFQDVSVGCECLAGTWHVSDNRAVKASD